MTWRNLGPIGYKFQTGAVTKIHGFRSYFFGRGRSHGVHCRPSRHPRQGCRFYAADWKRKVCCHLGKADARGGLAGYHFDRS